MDSVDQITAITEAIQARLQDVGISFTEDFGTPSRYIKLAKLVAGQNLADAELYGYDYSGYTIRISNHEQNRSNGHDTPNFEIRTDLGETEVAIERLFKSLNGHSFMGKNEDTWIAL